MRHEERSDEVRNVGAQRLKEFSHAVSGKANKSPAVLQAHGTVPGGCLARGF